MPKTYTKTVAVYTYDELEPRAQERAVDWWLSLGLDYEWWDSVYEDAETIGLKITEFDCGRSQHIRGDLTGEVRDTVQAILDNHGPKCDTYKLAQAYYQRKHDGYPMDEDEFLKRLLEEYLDILRREFEYLTSEEVVVESIRANEYEFLEDGSIY